MLQRMLEIICIYRNKLMYSSKQGNLLIGACHFDLFPVRNQPQK